MCNSLSEKNKLQVIKYPHFKIANDKVIFMGFRKKQLDRELIKTLMEIGYIDTIETLIYKEVPFENLEALQKGGFIAFKKSSGKKPESILGNILILSPHVDDAAFSLGGWINKIKDQINIDIINVFGRQDYTLYWELYPNSRTVDYPVVEEKVFWDYIDIHHGEIWEYKDASIREVYKKNHIIYTGLNTAQIVENEIHLLDDIVKRLDEHLQRYKYDCILAPLGTGAHIDHILLREACLKLHINDKILFYNELPYALSFESETPVQEVEKALGSRLTEYDFDSKDFIHEKRDCVMIYQSQLKKFQVTAILGYTEKILRHRAFKNNQLLEMLK